MTSYQIFCPYIQKNVGQVLLTRCCISAPKKSNLLISLQCRRGGPLLYIHCSPPLINELFWLLMLMSLFQCIDGDRHLHDTTITTTAHYELIFQHLSKVAHSSLGFWTCSIFPSSCWVLLCALCLKDCVKQILVRISIIRCASCRRLAVKAYILWNCNDCQA